MRKGYLLILTQASNERGHRYANLSVIAPRLFPLDQLRGLFYFIPQPSSIFIKLMYGIKMKMTVFNNTIVARVIT